MTEQVLDELVDELSRKLDEIREHWRSQQRGGERVRARGAGAKDKLTIPDRVLATVLYLRKLGTRDLIAQLFGVNAHTMTRAVHQVRPLLAENGHTIPPSTARFRTPVDVAVFLTSSSAKETKSARRVLDRCRRRGSGRRRAGPSRTAAWWCSTDLATTDWSREIRATGVLPPGTATTLTHLTREERHHS